MKVLFRQYTSYGKGSNECLDFQWVAEDTPESRMEAIEDFYGVDWESDKDAFINGKTSTLHYSQADDWDSPTGGCFTVTSKEDAFAEIEETYKKEKEKLIKLFGEEN